MCVSVVRRVLASMRLFVRTEAELTRRSRRVPCSSSVASLPCRDQRRCQDVCDFPAALSVPCNTSKSSTQYNYQDVSLTTFRARSSTTTLSDTSTSTASWGSSSTWCAATASASLSILMPLKLTEFKRTRHRAHLYHLYHRQSHLESVRKPQVHCSLSLVCTAMSIPRKPPRPPRSPPRPPPRPPRSKLPRPPRSPCGVNAIRLSCTVLLLCPRDFLLQLCDRSARQYVADQ